MEDYLKEIFHLSQEGNAVITASLAQRLGVAAPSVTNMVKRLNDVGLVAHTPYQQITLTAAGRRVAVEIVRHHRLIELYLSEFLEMPWERVHDEAERLEHVISEDLEVRIAEKLGQPGFDPHGDPIPSHSGSVARDKTQTLWEAAPGASVRVARVSDRDAGLLSYLSEVGLLPGVVVEVVSTSPYAATQTIRVRGEERVLGSALANTIRVQPCAESGDRTVRRVDAGA